MNRRYQRCSCNLGFVPPACAWTGDNDSARDVEGVPTMKIRAIFGFFGPGMLAAAAITAFALPAAADNFTGAIDNDWFKDGNWSGGFVPTAAVDGSINAGFDVTALIADSGGADINVSVLEIGDDSGGTVCSLTSEVDIMVEDASIGSARFTSGLGSGRLELVGASFVGTSVFSELEIDASDPQNLGTSAEGVVTITNGSMTAFNFIEIAQVFQGAGDVTGSLTVTNGNITSIGTFSEIVIASIIQGSPGNATASIRH